MTRFATALAAAALLLPTAAAASSISPTMPIVGVG